MSAQTCKSLGAHCTMLEPDSYFILHKYDSTSIQFCQIIVGAQRATGGRPSFRINSRMCNGMNPAATDLTQDSIL